MHAPPDIRRLLLKHSSLSVNIKIKLLPYTCMCFANKPKKIVRMRYKTNNESKRKIKKEKNACKGPFAVFGINL